MRFLKNHLRRPSYLGPRALMLGPPLVGIAVWSENGTKVTGIVRVK